MGLIINHFGESMDIVHSAIRFLTAVDYADAAILEQNIFRRGTTGALLLETVGDFRDFVPQSRVAHQIDLVHSFGL